MKHTLTLKLERETKGALRYQEISLDGKAVPEGDSEAYLIGTLYLRKSQTEQPWPQQLTVTVES